MDEMFRMNLKIWNFKSYTETQNLRIRAGYMAHMALWEKRIKYVHFMWLVWILEYFFIILFVGPSKYSDGVLRQPAKTFSRMKLKLTTQTALLV